MNMMSRRQAVQKLSATEVGTIREQTRELEAVLANPEGLRSGIQDPGALRRKIATNKAILAKDEGLRARGKDKDKIRSEIAKIKEVIARERPTRQMMEAKPGTPEFTRAVQANVRFVTKYGGLMQRLKDLQRRLDPDDPQSGFLDHAR